MSVKKYLTLITVVTLALTLIACSSQDDNSNEDNGTNVPREMEEAITAEFPTDEVTLKFAVPWGEEMYNERIKNHIEEKFPHITLEYMQLPAWNRELLQEHIARGDLPDIIFAFNLQDLVDLDLALPLDDIMKKYNFDVTKLYPDRVNFIRSYDPEGRMIGLPYEATHFGFWYNKRIFDLFSAPYPTDGMTWDQVVDLAAKVTGTRDGIEYMGLHFMWGEEVPLSQLVQSTKTNPETGEVLILDQPEYTRYLQLMERIYSIPGNYPEELNLWQQWGAEQRVAMNITNATACDWNKDQYEDGLDLQVVTMPVWPDRPGVGAQMQGHELTINPHGDHIDVAFQVISYFTSDEYQTWASSNGVGPVVRNPEIHKHWCSERHPNIESINIDVIFSLDPAGTYVSPWDQYVGINPHEMIELELDSVSYLRHVVEESTLRIKEVKAAE